MRKTIFGESLRAKEEEALIMNIDGKILKPYEGSLPINLAEFEKHCIHIISKNSKRGDAIKTLEELIEWAEAKRAVYFSGGMGIKPAAVIVNMNMLWIHARIKSGDLYKVEPISERRKRNENRTTKKKRFQQHWSRFSFSEGGDSPGVTGVSVSDAVRESLQQPDRVNSPGDNIELL